MAKPQKSKAVKVWTWRRALREHGPRDRNRSILLTLMMLSTWMDGDGYAFPGQASIAKAARISERTVRRHIEIAVRLGWLNVMEVNRGGQGWRSHEYRACIPADVELDDVDDDLRSVILAQDGDVDEGADTILAGRSLGNERPDNIVSAPCNVTDERADISAQRADTSDGTCGHFEPNVRTQLWPMNSPVTPQESNQIEGPPLRGARACEKENRTGLLNTLKPTRGARTGQGNERNAEDLARAVLKLQPVMAAERIALTLRAPIDDVKMILHTGASPQ